MTFLIVSTYILNPFLTPGRLTETLNPLGLSDHMQNVNQQYAKLWRRGYNNRKKRPVEDCSCSVTIVARRLIYSETPMMLEPIPLNKGDDPGFSIGSIVTMHYTDCGKL